MFYGEQSFDSCLHHYVSIKETQLFASPTHKVVQKVKKSSNPEGRLVFKSPHRLCLFTLPGSINCSLEGK